MAEGELSAKVSSLERSEGCFRKEATDASAELKVSTFSFLLSAICFKGRHWLHSS